MADGTCGPGSAVPAKRPRLDFPDETSSQQYDGDFHCFAGTSELLSGGCRPRRGAAEGDVREVLWRGGPSERPRWRLRAHHLPPVSAALAAARRPPGQEVAYPARLPPWPCGRGDVLYPASRWGGDRYGHGDTQGRGGSSRQQQGIRGGAGRGGGSDPC